LKDDGTVWGWGGNNYGQLGDGTKDDRNKPIKIPVSNVVMISAGGLNTMAMDNNGILKMSGDNTYGQLGDGTFANGLCKSSPQRVDFEYITLNPSTPGSNNSGENNSGISSPELFVNNVLRIAALLVIIIIVGAGVIFYIKKK
jgi:alpha-tubulin suppressor-like RCC1 family protein